MLQVRFSPRPRGSTLIRNYDGTESDLSYIGRWGVVPQFSQEPGITLTWVSLP